MGLIQKLCPYKGEGHWYHSSDKIYICPFNDVPVGCIEPAWSTGTVALLLLVPGGLSDPVKGEASICSDLDGSCLCLPDRLLYRLHQVLSIVHQHFSSLLKKKYQKHSDEEDKNNRNIVIWHTFEKDSAHLLWLLFADVGTTQHGGLDCGQDFELSADRGNALAHLKQGQTVRSKKSQSIGFPLFYKLLWKLLTDWTDLEQVGPDTLVGTLLGHLLGKSCDFIRSFSNVLGTLDEGTLVSAASTHQTWHLSHEQGHSFGSTDDVISLWGTTGTWWI